MKHKNILIGMFICCLVGLIINISNYNKNVLKNSSLLAVVDYSEDAKYSVIFDANGGELSGMSGLIKIREGVYGLPDYQTAQQGPGAEFSKKGNNLILYWSKDHLCSTRDLEVGANFSKEGHTVYYACYEQTNYDNGGIRYVQDKAFVSGDNVNCGDNVHVTTCYKRFNGSSRNMGTTDYCEYDQINGKSASGVVFRMQLSNEKVTNCSKNYTAYFYETKGSTGLRCGNTVDADLGICASTGQSGQNVYTPDTTNLTYNGKKFIGWAADDDGKNVNCSGELVTGNTVKINNDVNYYACYEQKEDCVNSEKIPNGKGAHQVKVCYNAKLDNNEIYVKPISEDFYHILTCASGYTLDNVSKSNIIENTCNKEGKCYRVYNLSCVGERPKVSASVGVVDGQYGNIEFNATSSVGIKGYYASRYYEKPTVNSEWVYDSRKNNFLLATPGSMFLWVIDNDNQISYAVMTSVIDKINVDTTLKTLEVKTNDGETLNTTKYAYDNASFNDVISSNYMMLSNSSSIDSKLLANSFNPFDTAYTVKTSSDKITVYATLTSNDASYVPGYEPRTVDLDYGVNTVLIKIKNKKGIERTYTILVTREDDRDATNYLKSLTVSEGKLKFDRYTTDYVVSVGKNKKSVNINGELSSLNASFVDGYGPRKVNLYNDSTTAAIKIKSETGSVRSYVITFVKSGEDVSESKSVMLSSLSLSKAHVAFDKKVSDYNTSVDYEIDSIDIYALAENGGDSVTMYKLNNGVTEKIKSKDVKLNVGDNNITIIVANKSGQSRTYNINIVRKENGLDISSDNALSLLDVSGYDIGFDPEKLDYQIKIKREKTLLIAATPKNNRAEVYIRGNDNLTAFSIVKIKVVSEDGQSREYTIDIKKDTVNKTIELIAIISGVVIIICGIIVIRVKKNRKSVNDYYA